MRLGLGLGFSRTVKGFAALLKSIIKDYNDPTVPEVVINRPINCEQSVKILMAIYEEQIMNRIKAAGSEADIPTDTWCELSVNILKRL